MRSERPGCSGLQAQGNTREIVVTLLTRSVAVTEPSDVEIFARTFQCEASRVSTPSPAVHPIFVAAAEARLLIACS